ncbi:MAG: hypothetical protein M0C28_27685 [Candidatus Moduliflexus flocculans]|nr:hypothetical protein [Candidatus Moduliflexus flocculans]
MVRKSEGEELPLIEALSRADVVCNGILQDTNKPVMFVREDEVGRLKPRSVIIDISCDEGMGFPFARPTSFNDPIFQVGDKITYYSVDHTPSYLWSAASSEISTALLPYLRTVLEGEKAWEQEPTVARAIDIRDGVVQNPNILSFQKRNKELSSWLHPGLKRQLGEALHRALFDISPLWLVKYRYRKATGRRYDPLRPRTLDEKLLWLMLYWRHPLKSRCADKYAVRSYVEESGLGHILIDLLGVYDSFREIDIRRPPRTVRPQGHARLRFQHHLCRQEQAGH